MNFVTVAFCDEGQDHAINACDALSAAGGVQIWRGLWILADQDGRSLEVILEPVRQALAHPPHMAPGLIVSPLDTRSGIDLGFTMSLEARAFYHRWLAQAYETRHGASESHVWTFFGAGDRRFGHLVEKLDAMYKVPRVVTSLCRMMAAHGSDKALGWHTYTPIYFLLLTSRPAPRSLLEIGIGTPNEDVPSSMGRNGTAGASLRAWRDFLPSTFVYGADVDHRILFQEERIATFFVDQLKPASFPTLFAQLPAAPLDLIVDDGLHTIEAARNTMASCLQHLDASGLYVLEDIQTEAVQASIDLAIENGLDGFVLEISNSANNIDNRLMVATRPSA